MNKLALSVPGFGNVLNPPGLKYSGGGGGVGTDLGLIVSGFANIAFLIGGFLVLFWFTWGVFQYLVAQGEKEKLAQARSRITWSIFGFIFLVASFFLSQYASTIFQPKSIKLTPVTNPSPCTPDIVKDCGENRVCVVKDNKPVCVEKK